MSDQYNLTEGNVLKKLLLVAFPLIGSQIIQMTYNLTDMFWLGRLSSDAVAASGTAGMYMLVSLSVISVVHLL
jgi:Na+-driven multidrug efflux pump